jgi:phage/plasmid-associated DNA primase
MGTLAANTGRKESMTEGAESVSSEPIGDSIDALASKVLSRINKVNEVSVPAGQGYPLYIYQVVNVKTSDVKIFIDYNYYSNFLANHFSIVYFNETIYIYDHGSNLYRPQTNEIETHIRNTLIEYRVNTKLPDAIRETMAHITSMGCYAMYPFNKSPNTIPVDNGIVKINYEDETIELLPHSPEHLFTFKLSVKYDKNVKNCLVIPLLKRMVEPENIKTLLQIPAQALLQMQTGNSYKKAYLLQGEPHTGKTSFLKLLYRLFGDEFTTAISLQQLCEDRFVGGSLEGKLLNIYDDLEDVALNVIDQFKTLTGDCRHGIERKYESKYTGRITAVHIFTCNYPPEYPEKVKRDAAFWSRWEYLKFPFEYSVNPNFYSEWYTDERISSFFNLVLSTMITMKDRGLISNSDIQEVMMNWSVNSDPLFDFVSGTFEPYSGKNKLFYSKTKLFAAYNRWCDDNHIPEHKRKPTMKSFTIALQAHQFVPERKQEKESNYETFATFSHITKGGLVLDLDYHDNIQTYNSPIWGNTPPPNARPPTETKT